MNTRSVRALQLLKQLRDLRADAASLHDAQLRIESHPGKGSTFACVFDARRLLTADAVEA